MMDHAKIDTESDFLDRDQRLKASMYHSMKQIAKEVEEEMGVTISAQVLATLSETLAHQVEVYASDLEDFAKHARRTNVNVDDVKLLARRNVTLLQHLDSVISGKAAQQEHKKKPRAAGRRTHQPEAEDTTND